MSSSTRAKVSNSAMAVVNGDALVRSSKIPAPLRFPLVAVLSMTLSGLLYSLGADWTTGQLLSVSRRNESWVEVGGLMAWRVFELALGWFGDYDGYDLASLMLLSHGPPLFLVAAFYEVSASAAILSLLIDAAATYIPFRLLRPLSPAHAASNLEGSPKVANKEIVVDSWLQNFTALLSATIYAVTIYAACKTYLPITLVTYFDEIPSITAAHNADFLALIPVTLIIGFATRSFIFTPALAAGDKEAAPFNPKTASLLDTFWFNVWGYSDRKKVMLQRTIILMLCSGINTFLQLVVTVNGVEATGALAYGAVWVAAAGLTGVAFHFVAAA